MFSKDLIFLIIATLACYSTGQVIINKSCQSVSVVENFDVNKYLGTWSEIEKYPAKFETGGKCVYAVYTDNGDGIVGVRNTNVDSEGEYSEIVGTARLADAQEGSAKLLVNFPTVSDRESPYWVLSTDYENHSIVWSCTNIGNNKSIQFLWYLSRTQNPSTSQRDMVRTKMEEAGLDTNHLIPTDQSGCPNPHAIV